MRWIWIVGAPPLILLMVGCSGSSGRSASTAVPAREPTPPALTHYVNPLLKIEMDIPIGWIVDPANDTVIGGVFLLIQSPRLAALERSAASADNDRHGLQRALAGRRLFEDRPSLGS